MQSSIFKEIARTDHETIRQSVDFVDGLRAKPTFFSTIGRQADEIDLTIEGLPQELLQSRSDDEVAYISGFGLDEKNGGHN